VSSVKLLLYQHPNNHLFQNELIKQFKNVSKIKIFPANDILTILFLFFRMENSATSTGTARRKRTTTNSRVTWSEDMVKKIFDFSKDRLLEGKAFEV
jgi:hypothetical protein